MNVPNASDASIELLNAYKAQIADLMRKMPGFESWVTQTEAATVDALLDALAHEVAFYPAMAGLIEATPQGRTGPKAKTAQALLLAQVRNTLAKVDAHLPQWKNGRDQRTYLTDFCAQLISMSGYRAGGISSRTADNAPVNGWEPLP
ncbi:MULTISPECIES: hypothetical protein [unclassified Acidovorax]|uniref:hypothetical protein n=1 Tax=unclassified Acidovorax TaxID=2684926 RepID=UPI00117746A7|nr:MULTISPECIES: hypothetical protein [unclassified Acidovorax]